ncbi:BrnT family toxin [Arenibaculum sp.]|uniref:BrnT family toxin n=1 Tax=Arenibaculum sp. TaxID=2865862 RepID=UPI002E1007E1|nr:BrnT family toxin [Arenibaculum sp.]
MDIEFDTAKDQANRSKHGVSLALGQMVLEHCVADIPDAREYSESRRVAYGLVAGRLFACVYTMRGDAYRLISVRKANAREQRRWLR